MITLTKTAVVALGMAFPAVASAQDYSAGLGGPEVALSHLQRRSTPRTPKTPPIKVRRPEIVSGSRVTLFANFLQDRAGYVYFDLGGATTQCVLIDWTNTSVTVDMPNLGLSAPMNAQIRIVKPDGRVVKTFRVLYVSQPDIVVHRESVPQPSPATPHATPPTFAQPGANASLR